VLAIVGLAMLIFVVSCAAAGVRLLRLARGNAGSPAWLCGHGLCLIAIVGFPLGLLSGNGFARVGDVTLSLAALSLLANGLGVACFFGFTVQVFRPGALWAHAVAGAAVAAIAMSATGVIVAVGSAPSDASSFEASFGWAATFHWVSVSCFGWMGLEALGEWLRSRRRVSLGLSDPLVCHRLLMWGVFGCSTTLLFLVLAAVQHSGQPAATSATAQLGQALFGITSSAAILFAFFPPRSYLARLQSLPIGADRG
jgi:hypothetical protein